MRVNKSNKNLVLCFILIILCVSTPIFIIGQENHIKPLNQNLIYSTGVIVFLSFEGGFFGIKSFDGNNYDPINLPPHFKIVDLRVVFLAKILNVMSIHMWGRVIKVLFIGRIFL